jgi:hypothetical protein
MRKALELDPHLLRLLELLEYRALLAKSKCQRSPKADQLLKLSNKYLGKIPELLDKLKLMNENTKRLSESTREMLLGQAESLSNQPIELLDAELEYDKNGICDEVGVLQGELAEFYIHRLNSLHKDVTDYFQKYWNREVKEEYMRLLSSPEPEDHGRALSNFWAEARGLPQFPANLEEAVVMFFNYFLEYTHDPLKIAAIKIMCILFHNPHLSFNIYFVYERVLFNLFSQIK